MTHTVLSFDSIESLIDQAQKPSGWNTKDSQRRDSEYAEFSGTLDFPQARDFAIHGWHEGLGRMKAAVDSVTAATEFGMIQSYALDVAGAYPLPHLAAAGEAFCMASPAPIQDRARPIVRLATSVSISAMFEAREIFNYGAGLVAFVDALEKSGFRVELNTLKASQCGDDSLSIMTRIKSAEDALDLGRAAFALASASWNRRIHFAVMESCGLKESQWGSTYGRPRVPCKSKDAAGDGGLLFLPGPQMFSQGGPELRTPESAFKAMAPKIESMLRDKLESFPDLQFARAA